MLRLKLHRPFYFFALLASLISFSGIADTIPIEKPTIEVIYSKTSNRHRCYNYENGLFSNLESSNHNFYNYNFNSLLVCEHNLQVLNYHSFIEKHIPLQKAKLLLKSQYYTAFIDIGNLV